MLCQPVILVIEDDPHIQELLKVCLAQEGFRVAVEGSGLCGLDKAKQGSWDLIILDLMLPGLDGLSICQELSSGGSYTPILILTAKGEEVDKVLGLKLGADDYMVKPFSPRELTARVEAILRRVAKPAPTQLEIRYGELEINPSLRTAAVNEFRLTLTPKEFELLHLLAVHPGRVFTRDDLLNRIWGYEYLSGCRSIDEHIKNLRQKIKEADARKSYIQTVWGVGYKLEESS